MGLLGRIFGGKDSSAPRRGDTGPAPLAAQEDEQDEARDSAGRGSGPRRDVLQIVLRDTMRKHGIPSDWIESRFLTITSATRGAGMHLLLVVRQGDDRLVTFVHAFQESFRRELLALEPRSADWAFSLSWQFEGKPQAAHSQMPDPGSWRAGKAAAPAPDDDELQQDLQALFAIRDAALRPPAPAMPDFEPTRPGDEEDEARTGRKRR